MRSLAGRASDVPILQVDTGDFLAAPGEPGADVLDTTTVAVMNLLGVDAANVAVRELANTPTGLRPGLSQAQFPLLGANLTRTHDRRPVAPATVVVPAGDLTVGIVGVFAADRFSPARSVTASGLSLAIEDPILATQRAVSELRPQVDWIIVLARMRLEDARNLAHAIPDIDLIATGQADEVTDDPERIGRTTIVAVGDRGRRIGVVTLTADGSPADWELAYLDEGVADDPEVRAIVSKASGELVTFDRLPPVPGEPAADASFERAIYTGPEACSSCHPAADQAWHNSAHVTAFATLQQEGREFDPACVSCHVTGAGRWSGFEDELSTPELVGVGCEACHGPGYNHLRTVPVTTPYRPAVPCEDCHRAPFADGFDRARAWRKIAH